MGLESYLEGLAWFGGTVGAVVAAAVVVAQRRLPHLDGVARVLAAGILATAGIVAVHLLPGFVGWLSRGTALALALAALGAALAVPRAAAGPAESPPDPPPSTLHAWAAAALAAVAVGACSLAATWERLAAPATDIDTLTFHLPNVAGWIQSGTFWRLDQFTPLLATGNYPHNGDVVFLAVVQPWENDAFIGLVSLPFVVLAALAVYGIALELRTPRATAALLGAVFCSLPVIPFAAYEGAKTDTAMYACFGAGTFFLLRHFRSGRRADLMLAGIGLGLAFGTKWYGVTAVAAVLAVWVGSSLLAGRPLRRVAGQAAALAGLIAAAGGFWLVRNLVESGNPVFPVNVEPAGVTLWAAPPDLIRECVGFAIGDYAFAPSVWREHILPAFRAFLGWGGLLIVAGALAAVVLAALGRRDGRARPAVIALAGAAALIAVFYALTPYGAFGPEDQPIFAGQNSRYVVPALLLAAALCAWAMARSGRAMVVLELAALAATARGLDSGFDLDAEVLAGAVGALALAALCGLGLMRLPPRHRPLAIAALSCLLVASAVAAGHARQRGLNDDRYRDDAAIAWIQENAPEGHRIGLAGVWGNTVVSPVWPAFGPRLGNEVEFVGEFVDEQLREYEIREEWAAAIRRRGIDLLLVGDGGYGRGCDLPGQEGDDNAWARAEGFEPLASSGRLTLYRVPPAVRSGRRPLRARPSGA